MKRREAIKYIAAASIAATFLPACSEEDKGPVYENVPLEKGQRVLIEVLTKTILPTEGTPITTPESTTDFILTMLNDCTAPADVQQYLQGIKAFQEQVKEAKNTSFKRLKGAEQLALLQNMTQNNTDLKQLKYFFDKTIDLTKSHFMGSEYFMKNKLDFEFAPGRYLGCTPV